MSALVLPAPRIWTPGPGAEGLLDRIGRGTPTERTLRRVWERLLMAGSFGDTYEKKVLDAVFGATALSIAGTFYFGLWGTAGSLTDSSDGGTAGEISGGSYARVAMTNNATNFPAASGTLAAKKNGVAIVFPTATADWNSGNTINQVACLDANAGTSADKIVVWGDLTVAKRVLNGDTAQFAINDFQVTLD